MFVPVAKILKRYKLVKVFYLLFYSAILSSMVIYHRNFVTTVSKDLGSVSYNFDILIVVQFSKVIAFCTVATTILVLVAVK